MIGKIREGMDGQQVADLLDDNFKYLDDKIGTNILEITEDITNFKNDTNTSLNEQLAEYEESIDKMVNSSIVGADEEDITSDKGFAKFADRAYDPDKFSGKGYKILRKKMYKGKNTLFLEDINEPNTVYEIRYDFDLNEQEITIPEGCTLKFEGGSLKNGILLFNKSTIICDGDYQIFESIIPKDSVTNNYIKPEWFGAIGYDVNVITDNTFNTISEGLFDSTSNILECLQFCYKVHVTILRLTKLYLISDEINIDNPSAYKGFQIIGNGSNSGFIVKMNDQSKSVLSINKYKTGMTFLDKLSNFSIYISRDSQTEVYLDSVIYMNETIRSTVEDVHIHAGYSNISNGLFTIHSVANNNVFLNVFNRCKGFATTTGNGLHYKHETYHPTLQTVTNCAFQGLGGCGIVADVLPITGGTFGGIIEGNELEGNSMGSIALSAVGYLKVSNNYYEGGTPKQNFYPDLPPCIWTFGYVNATTFNVKNLDFSNNQMGLNEDSILDYAILCAGLPEQKNSTFARVKISNNIFSPTAKIKYITYVDNAFAEITSNFFTKNLDFKETFIKGIIPILIKTNVVSNTFILYSDDECTSTIQRENVEINKVRNLLAKSFDISRYISSKYPYLQPSNTSESITFDEGDIVNNTYGKGAYKCIKGGVLHYLTKANFTEGSNIITIQSGANWNWSVGQQIQSEHIDGGVAEITNIDGKSFTLSSQANKTITDYLYDALLIPLSDFDLYNRVGSKLPTNVDTHLKEGYQFYHTNDKKIKFWNGTEWTDALGVPISFKSSDIFSKKPINPPIGFSFFCTDKQTTEGATNGIMIYYKGNDVWVDALGRIVE